MRHPSFEQLDHRPWPLPKRPWVCAQRWLDLAFIHWPIDAAVLRPLIPASLELEEFDGTAWIGVVPFHMMIRPRFVPAIPGLSYFPEINVRTYVRAEGRGGVWFFSLDATSALAVWGAKRFFHLPYFGSRISIGTSPDGALSYDAARHAGEASFRVTYRPTGDVHAATPGALDHWLTERYCLYTADEHGRVYRGDVHHEPWPLQRAEVRIAKNTMLAPIGAAAPSESPIVHFAKRIDVAIWSLVRLDGEPL